MDVFFVHKWVQPQSTGSQIPRRIRWSTSTVCHWLFAPNVCSLLNSECFFLPMRPSFLEQFRVCSCSPSFLHRVDILIQKSASIHHIHKQRLSIGIKKFHPIFCVILLRLFNFRVTWSQSWWISKRSGTISCGRTKQARRCHLSPIKATTWRENTPSGCW